MMRAAAQSFLRYPLSLVLSHTANVRVLRELSRHGGELSAPMLAERTRLTKASVLASLDELSRTGYAESLGSHRQRLYRIDRNHPLVPGLTAIFTAEGDRFHAIIEAVTRAIAGTGAIAAWLYGSAARGEDGVESDLDVALVEAAGQGGSSKAKVGEACRGLEESLRFSASITGIDTADVLRLAAEQDPWWASVCADAVPLLGPDPLALLSELRAAQRRRA